MCKAVPWAVVILIRSGDWCFVYIYRDRVCRGLKVNLPSHPCLDPAVLFPGEKLCRSPGGGKLYRGNKMVICPL